MCTCQRSPHALNPHTHTHTHAPQLSPLERARAHLALAKGVALLFKIHLQLHGQRPEEHTVHADLVGGVWQAWGKGGMQRMGGPEAGGPRDGQQERGQASAGPELGSCMAQVLPGCNASYACCT